MLRRCCHPGCGLRTLGRWCVDHEPASSEEGRGRVLHVESDRFSAALIEATLTDAGFEVDWFSCGRIALDAARNAAYDLHLVDTALPDGDRLADDLTRLRPRVPTVLVCTSPGAPVMDSVENALGRTTRSAAL